MALEYTQREMADALDIKQATYSAMEVGQKSNLSIDHMDTIVEKFGVNPRFLLKGEDPMYDKDKPTSTQLANVGCYLVPVAAQAGYLDGLPNHERHKLPKVVIPGFEGMNSMVFEVEGDSMYPMIQDGDMVACSKVTSPREIRNGLVYVIVSRLDGILVKYLSPRRDHVKCIPHDKVNFKITDLSFEDIKEIWEVQLKITRNVTNQGIVTENIGPNTRVDRLENIVAKLAEKGGL